jgi:hypothetical protein
VALDGLHASLFVTRNDPNPCRPESLGCLVYFDDLADFFREHGLIIDLRLHPVPASVGF